MRHSQRANDSLLHAWVIVQRDGVIESGHCTCMAGLGEVCSHIGAVLFYVEAVQRVKGSSTCTQMPCSWIVPKSVKEIPYSKVADLTFTMPKVAKIQHTKSRGSHHYSDTVPLSDLPKVHVESPTSLKPPAQKSLSAVPVSSGTCTLSQCVHYTSTSSHDDRMKFLSRIAQYQPAICALVPPFSDAYVPASSILLPAPLNDLYSPENEELTYTELLRICEGIDITITAENYLSFPEKDLNN